MSPNHHASQLTFRLGPLANVPAVLRQLGCDAGVVISGAGLDPAELRDTDHRLPYSVGGGLLQACVAATGCEHFGLLVGEMATPSHLGIAGFLARASSSVRQSLEALVENLDLHEESGRCSLDLEEGYGRLSYRLPLPDVPAIEQVYDLSAAVMCQLMRSLCGPEWKPVEVLLPRHPPRDATPYRHFFQSVVIFNAESCSLLMPEHCLAHAPATRDELLFRHIADEARSLHELHNTALVDTLPSLLQHGLMADRCSAPDIADALGLHERTLHRRLRAAGTTFRRELDSVRASLSRQLLQGTSLPVCDIASSLGYADSSGFIRAFRRWTGASPANWRRDHRLH